MQRIKIYGYEINPNQYVDVDGLTWEYNLADDTLTHDPSEDIHSHDDILIHLHPHYPLKLIEGYGKHPEDD